MRMQEPFTGDILDVPPSVVELLRGIGWEEA